MAKTLCKTKSLLRKDLSAYIRIVDRPKFVCKSCGRVANEKKLVCKPLKIIRE